MTTNILSDPVRDAVREHYDERARSDSSCCGSGPAYYAAEEIDLMPQDVASFSLGCGNAVGEAKLQPGETVLDLGSGGGLECFIAARAVGEAGRVIGIDMTPSMLERARRAADRMGFRQVEFRQGLIEDMPVEDELVDVIISNCVINLSPDKPAVLREMARVLKPGGRIAISDIVSEKPVPEAFREDMALWSACASGAMTVSDWETHLRSLGFEAVRIDARHGDEDLGVDISAFQPFSAIITARKPAP